MELIKIKRINSIPVIAAAAAFTALFLFVIFGTISEHERGIQDQRFHVISDLSIIRAKIEGTLNSRLLLAKGLVAYISLNNNISSANFKEYASKLIGNDALIKNVSILKGTTIVFAYPEDGNLSALGKDLALIESQRETVLRAITTGENIIAGPVNLIQGGTGIISRIPIFISDTRVSDSRGKYWGQASIVILQDSLFNEAGVTENNLDIAIKGRDGLGDKGDIEIKSTQ